MHKVLESKMAYAAVCAVFVLGICMSLMAGGSLPIFGTGLFPDQVPTRVAQSPLPPPSPDTPWLTLAQSPLPPPSPDTPWLTLAQSPLPPPSPDTPWLQAA